MKKLTFAFIFFGTHIAFIVFTIHKQNQFISLSYEKQKKEALRDELMEKQKQLTQQYHALTNPTYVKAFAQKQLSMEPVALTQVRKLQDHDATIQA